MFAWRWCFGIQRYPVPDPPKTRPKHDLFDEEETKNLLHTLIYDQKKKNYSRANVLIKNLVKKIDSREKFEQNFKAELESALNCANSLVKLVDNFHFNYQNFNEKEKNELKKLICFCKKLIMHFTSYSKLNEEIVGLKFLLENMDKLKEENIGQNYFTIVNQLQSMNDEINKQMVNELNNEKSIFYKSGLLDLYSPPSTDHSFNDLDCSVLNFSSSNETFSLDESSDNELFPLRKCSSSPAVNCFLFKEELDLEQDWFSEQNIHNNNDYLTNPTTMNFTGYTFNYSIYKLLNSIWIEYCDVQKWLNMSDSLIIHNKEGLFVQLFLVNYKPHPQITVFLLLFTNYSPETIYNIQFFAEIKKVSAHLTITKQLFYCFFFLN